MKTLWDWYNTVAITSGDETFIAHGKPVLGRWNHEVPRSLIREILQAEDFEIFVEPNPYRVNGMLWDRDFKLESDVKPVTNLRASVEFSMPKDILSCVASFLENKQ